MTPLSALRETVAAIGMGVLVVVTVVDGLLTRHAPDPYRGRA